VTVAVGLCL